MQNLHRPYPYLLKPFGERELRITIEMALKRRDVEKALRESDQRYRLLFLNSNEGIMILSTRGKVEEVNPRILAQFFIGLFMLQK